MLDRAAFTRTLNLWAASVLAKSVDALRKSLQKQVLDLPKVRSVVADEQDPLRRLVLLAEGVKEVDMEILASFDAHLVEYQLKLGYELLTADEVLSKLLPEGIEVPASFETVGHLAHLNLRAEHEPYKRVIGQVILDKNPALRCVVNKVGTIDTTFRFFQMEVLAGTEDDFEVEVREEGCRFRFDYSRVYWNSRLQAEHRRLIEAIPRDALIWDAFCGVGPFAIPAAKKGCQVWANDLNPESILWLKDNATLNRVKLDIFNLDARQFIRQQLGQTATGKPVHLIMNLPAIAYQFLDIFQPGDLVTYGDLLTIHCYTFCQKGQDPLDNIRAGLCTDLDFDIVLVKHVRTVAPNKDMYCVSFKLKLCIKRRKLI